MKVLNWCLNHLKILLAIVVFGVTLGVVGGSMLGSYNDYKAYEQKYNENDLAVRSALEAAPKMSEINNNFQTKLKNSITAYKDDMKITSTSPDEEEYVSKLDGKLELTIDLAEKSLVDLNFEIRNAYVDAEENPVEVKDLLSIVYIRVNGSLMEDEVNLPAENWQHLVMTGFALPKGLTSITIEPKNDKKAYMPDIQSITFSSNEAAQIVPAE